MSNSVEAKNMQSLVKEFCKEWKPKGEDLEEFENDTIQLIGKIQTQYVSGVIKADKEPENLHSEFETVMEDLKFIKNELKILRERDESLKSAIVESRNEIKEELEKSKSSKPRATRSSYGKFSSKVAKDFAEENGINEEDIEGTGKGDKITKKDIQKHLTKSSPKEKKEKKIVKKKPCGGTKDSGSPCKNSGTILINGLWYCKKHEKQAKDNIDNLSEDEYSDYDENNDNPMDNYKSVEDEMARFREESMNSVEDSDELDDE